jgi:hypothetical protein
VIRKLLLFMAVVAVGALVVGDVVAKGVAERAIASEVRKRTSGVVDVDAEISSFPFLGRLLVQGKVPELALTLDEVSGHGVNVTKLDVVVRDLTLDRAALLGGKHVRIKALRSMTVTASISEATVRAVTHADVRLLEGRATVTAAGRTVEATPTVADGHITLTVASVPVPVSLPLPDAGLLPCPVEVHVVAGALELSCTATTLPEVVVDAIGGTTLRA